MRRRASDGPTVRRSGGLAFGIALVWLTAGPPDRQTAQREPLNTGALFLVFPVGARAAGMGQAASALQGHGEAAFWNPAGLATMEASEFALHTATLVAGRSHAVTAYFASPPIGVIGGALYLVDYGDLESTDSIGNPIARVSPRNLEFLASYATAVAGPFVLGLSYKLVEFRVDCSGDCRNFPNGRGVTHALDVGGQFTLGVGGGNGVERGGLRVGVALRNVGFKLQVQNEAQADALPSRFVVGALYRLPLRPFRGGGPTGDDRFDLRVAADVDSPWGDQGGSEMRVGLDVGFRELVRLRGGYAFVRDGLSGPSVGMGLTSGSIGVDLARTFLTASDLVVPNPTFFSFHVAF